MSPLTWWVVSLPVVIAVQPDSPAALAGVVIGDVLLTVNGVAPRDVIQYQLLVDEPEVSLEIERGGLAFNAEIEKNAGAQLGIEVQTPLFDQVRTCDNHCAFCFIYQLPAGMRKSLYLKDDDFRLSFLYGNFTTLTRFTEMDLERVVSEGLSPLYVSIHATDPVIRSEMLRNRRGGTSLRWLRALLDHEVEVHGQVVVCPGVNDADVLDQTLCGVLNDYPELASVAVVPLGISDFSNEPTMRAHTLEEAQTVVNLVHGWQDTFTAVLGKPMVFAADEYYLLAGVDFPEAERYDDFGMHEDGIGMARTFEAEFNGRTEDVVNTASGFFASVDGAPASGYRAPRTVDGQSEESTPVAVSLMPRRNASIGILTGTYGAQVLTPLVSQLDKPNVRVIEVENKFFGGNIGVTGLMVGEDLIRVLAGEPDGHRYLLPDVCLSGGRFLDGLSLEDLPRHVEVLETNGAALRSALGANR